MKQKFKLFFSTNLEKNKSAMKTSWPGFSIFLAKRRRESCLASIERPSNVITLVVKHRLLDLKTTSSFTKPIEFHSSWKREVPAEIF